MSDSTPRRKPLSKALRFAVLERDNFTCQYCGATPKNGALEVDHIIPVAEGGDTVAENLITSCEPCNKGKGSKRRRNAKLPDMSSMTAEAQRVAEEIRAWQKVHRKANEQVTKAAEEIRATHYISIPHHVLAAAIRKYGIAEVNYAVECVEAKGISGFEGQNAYLHGVLRNRSQGQTTPAGLPKVERGLCPFGSSRRCPEGCEEGCVTPENSEGYREACNHFLDLSGGWDDMPQTEYVHIFIKAWRSGDEQFMRWFLDLSKSAEEAYSQGFDSGVKHERTYGAVRDAL